MGCLRLIQRQRPSGKGKDLQVPRGRRWVVLAGEGGCVGLSKRDQEDIVGVEWLSGLMATVLLLLRNWTKMKRRLSSLSSEIWSWSSIDLVLNSRLWIGCEFLHSAQPMVRGLGPGGDDEMRWDWLDNTIKT